MTTEITIPIPHVLQVEYRDPATLKGDPDNARKHPKRQLKRLMGSISEFGFNQPVLIDPDNKIIAGHARVQAALGLALTPVPCLCLRHLSETQAKALALADNKIGDLSYFDPAKLAQKLSELCAVDFVIEATGFETAEIDVLLALPELGESDPDDRINPPDRLVAAITQPGDLWLLGQHRLLCGDAREQDSYTRLLGQERAGLVFADPPYNVRVPGHVSGLGAVRHGDFAMACGEMSRTEFTAFLATVMASAARFSHDGSIHYWCMDWRHILEMLNAGESVYSEPKALAVWNKTNGGMGSFYRSKHELIFVFKNGTAPFLNNIDLGRHGRYRTNVWDYPGANAFGADRDRDLADHPTVKPVALVADAIRDCSRRGGLVLDPFAGSGTTILAAERTGRKAAAIEIDPHYVDVAIKRWQALTGGAAMRLCDSRTFDDIAASRPAEAPHE